MTEQLDAAGSRENYTGTEEARHGASEGSCDPMVVLVKGYVVNGARGEANSTSDQSTR
jgi:hypothetical protein